jgi:predicted nucleic acid-binding protein
VFELLGHDLLCIDFDLGREYKRVQQLMARYADLPTSLADACLVRMAELFPDLRVMTLDRDFSIYRRHGRQAIPLLSPFV